MSNKQRSIAFLCSSSQYFPSVIDILSRLTRQREVSEPKRVKNQRNRRQQMTSLGIRRIEDSPPHADRCSRDRTIRWQINHEAKTLFVRHHRVNPRRMTNDFLPHSMAQNKSGNIIDWAPMEASSLTLISLAINIRAS
jgi:hypothetical protein